MEPMLQLLDAAKHKKAERSKCWLFLGAVLSLETTSCRGRNRRGF